MNDQSIIVERNPGPERLASLGVTACSVWSSEISVFPWHYDARETCYFLAGEVTVTPAGGRPVRMGRGDLVTFPAGLSCTWQVDAPVRKHYRFE